MAINVGKLNKRIAFLKVKEESDEYGDHLVTAEIATRWANLKAVRGSEYYEAQKIRQELTYKITCRFLQGITPDMLIAYGDRKFSIVDVINIDEEDEWLEIRATEDIKKPVGGG